jgi:ABC-type phosphate transport system auxiliary subunit
MAKKSTGESDETRLKKKISATMKKDEKNLSGDPATRSLRKRLKRVQRKRRAVSLRKKHAAGKEAATKA